ncbi:uncharacterized protein LOC127252155 [Andrographis paniculata]|uniref:uncharacterized protein LOC127252155 n=1 Tax=Andrographis paniculata TaxID=175694 RepID=UPI0021E74966|nr:uncharacterized protein LOC127252155 [Andrographis paniculata]
MLPPLLLLFANLVLLSSAPNTTASAAADPPKLSAYQVLLAYGFPVGLLPQGVTSYELDPATGKFSVYLNSSCSFSIEGYSLKYKATISGTISRGKIKDLKGIQVKVLFFWIDIVEVIQDGDEIAFSVGILSASFPIDNFYESPQCGCGFDCVNSERQSSSIAGDGDGLMMMEKKKKSTMTMMSLRKVINHHLFQM